MVARTWLEMLAIASAASQHCSLVTYFLLTSNSIEDQAIVNQFMFNLIVDSDHMACC